MSEKRQEGMLRAVGKAIAAKRAAAELSQERVAEALGISREAVSRMETGASGLSVTRLVELAEIFDCGIEELLTEASNRELDQARNILVLLEGCSEQDREMVPGIVRQLAERLRRV